MSSDGKTVAVRSLFKHNPDPKGKDYRDFQRVKVYAIEDYKQE